MNIFIGGEGMKEHLELEAREVRKLRKVQNQIGGIRMELWFRY